MSLPAPQRVSPTEFISTGWTEPKCKTQQTIKHSGIQKLVLPMSYRNYLYQEITKIIRENSEWFRPPIPESMYAQIIRIPTFLSMEIQNPGVYSLQMSGLRFEDSSIEPILEYSLLITQSIQTKEKEKILLETLDDSRELNESESESESLHLEEYLEQEDDIEEWEPPVEEETNLRIVDPDPDPDGLIDAIEERIRQTQKDLEELKKLRNQRKFK
jgi:hypothetical protein